jgi:hypothetical protein
LAPPLIFGPTAAVVEVSGRVMSPIGVGLRNVRVWITDQEGNTREVLTNSFGFFTFHDVEVGETYVIGATSRRYRFSTRTIQVSDSLTDVNFSALE